MLAALNVSASPHTDNIMWPRFVCHCRDQACINSEAVANVLILVFHN